MGRHVEVGTKDPWGYLITGLCPECEKDLPQDVLDYYRSDVLCDACWSEEVITDV